MAGIPNFYNPNLPVEDLQRSADIAGHIGEPFNQLYMKKKQMEMESEQSDKPSPIALEDLSNIRNALMQGADPVELAKRHQLAASGAIPHVAFGLSPDHPIAATHPRPVQPAGIQSMVGPQAQAQPPSQPEEGQEAPPAAPADASEGQAVTNPQVGQGIQSSDNIQQSQQQPQPMMSRPVAPPPVQVRHPLTNGQLAAFIQMGGPRAFGAENASERADRMYKELLLKRAGAEEVARTKTEGAKDVAKIREEGGQARVEKKVEGAKEVARIGARAKIGAAAIMADAKKYAADQGVARAIHAAGAKGVKDQQFDGLVKQYQSDVAAISRIESQGMGDMNKEDVAALRDRIKDSAERIKSYKATPAPAPGAAQSTAAPQGGRRHVKLKDGRTGWLDAENNFDPDR